MNLLDEREERERGRCCSPVLLCGGCGITSTIRVPGMVVSLALLMLDGQRNSLSSAALSGTATGSLFEVGQNLEQLLVAESLSLLLEESSELSSEVQLVPSLLKHWSERRERDRMVAANQPVQTLPHYQPKQPMDVLAAKF